MRIGNKLFSCALFLFLLSCTAFAQAVHATSTPTANSCLPAVGKFKTFTQVQLGASGSAANTFLLANFGACFGGSSGLVVGADVDLDLLNLLKLDLHLGLSTPPCLTFDTAAAVANFLPQLGAAGSLVVGLLNPTTCPAGLLAGDLVALHLNVAFDEVFPAFGAADFNLTQLVFVKGPCAGLSVGAVLDIANQVLSGCVPPALAKAPLFVAANIDACVAAVNTNFLDGTSVGAFLALPGLNLQANLNLFLQLPAVSASAAVTATVSDLLSLNLRANAALQVVLAGIAASASADASLCLADAVAYNAWRLDLDASVSLNTALNVNALVLSSLPSSVTGIAVDAWVKLDLLALVNYVLNFHGVSVHAAVDVQAAILCLLNPSLSVDAAIAASGLSGCNRAVVAAIVADARLNGVGFVPACGQKVGVVAEVAVAAGVKAHVLLELLVPSVDLSISSNLCIAL